MERRWSEEKPVETWCDFWRPIKLLLCHCCFGIFVHFLWIVFWVSHIHCLIAMYHWYYRPTSFKGSWRFLVSSLTHVSPTIDSYHTYLHSCYKKETKIKIKKPAWLAAFRFNICNWDNLFVICLIWKVTNPALFFNQILL